MEAVRLATENPFTPEYLFRALFLRDMLIFILFYRAGQTGRLPHYCNKEGIGAVRKSLPMLQQ